MRVGVLRGGPGHEYKVSLETGQSVLRCLPEGKYESRDILIDKNGVWHLAGLPATPSRIAKQIDVFFNALHGEFGEDGQVQRILDSLAVPYTGSGLAASALAMNKQRAKELFRQAGLRVPLGLTIAPSAGRRFDPAVASRQVFQRVSPPWVVKPVDRGSSVGLYFARTVWELAEALAAASAYSDTLLVEHHLRGREATVGIVDNFRGQDNYVLPIVEIRKPGRKPVWTYDDKYSGETEEICPAAFSEAEKQEMERMAVAAHRALGLRHYSRSDFILTSHGVYLLETNSLPGLTTESLLPKALAAVGCAYADFLDHVITLAVTR
ncbi:MAG: D-alanine--D-alanine ligase [Candidatus Vogelbacteria bacterium]|nr:D-alanine--D-alanine ligase [Candidatus Vogelbacteria bacterium]